MYFQVSCVCCVRRRVVLDEFVFFDVVVLCLLCLVCALWLSPLVWLLVAAICSYLLFVVCCVVVWYLLLVVVCCLYVCCCFLCLPFIVCHVCDV